MTNVKVLFLLFFCLSLKVFAYEPKEGNVTATVGPFVSRTDYPGSDSGAKAPWFGDVGLIVQGDLNQYGALEIAIFHMQKAYFRKDSASVVAEKTELMHVTMGYRYFISPLWSASLTFSSSYPMGEPRIIHDDFAPAIPINTSASDAVDYGFDFSIATELWNNDRFSVVSDIRYSLSITDKEDETGSHYGIMLGLKYLIQEKYPNLTKEKN